MPLKSLQPVRIRIDGRCNYPQDPDPATDSPTGIYRVAQQNPADAIATLKDGTVITLTCYTYGQNISDAAGNLTSIWLHIALSGGRQGYVPDVNAGNYSARQLKALGIHRCS